MFLFDVKYWIMIIIIIEVLSENKARWHFNRYCKEILCLLFLLAYLLVKLLSVNMFR